MRTDIYQTAYTVMLFVVIRLLQIRWVVESANARIKSWKYFNHVLPTNQIPYIGDYIRIVCAICNKYFKPLCNADSDDDSRLASKMRALSSNANIKILC